MRRRTLLQREKIAAGVRAFHWLFIGRVLARQDEESFFSLLGSAIVTEEGRTPQVFQLYLNQVSDY